MGEDTLKSMVNKYIEDLPEGQKFGARDICNYVYMKTLGRRNPLDGTVGRMMREWRATNEEWTIVCCDYKKALYQKVKS